MLFCTLYKPPDSSKHLDKNFTSKLDEMITMIHHENKETIIAGDLNCNYLGQDDHKNIKDLFHINGLKQIIKQPTRVTENSSTLIDIILTTYENRIYNSIVYPNSFSDHELIGVIRKLHIQKYQPQKNCVIYHGYQYLVKTIQIKAGVCLNNNYLPSLKSMHL